jgi:hypothetical protein
MDSPSPRVQCLVELYRSFFNDLFTDSTNLNRLIPIYEHLEQDELRNKLETACKNCSWARVNDFLVCLSGIDYQNFAENTHMKALEKLVEHGQHNLRKQYDLLERVNAGLFANPDLAKRLTGIRQRMIHMEQLKNILKKPEPSLEAARAMVELSSEIDAAASSQKVVALLPIPEAEQPKLSHDQEDISEGMRFLFG